MISSDDRREGQCEILDSDREPWANRVLGEPSRALVNLASVHVGWFSCVLGAARGKPWVGPVVVLALVVLHLLLSRSREKDAGILIVAGLLGFALDGAATSAGVLSFPPGSGIAWIAPLWMAALWINLATALNLGLRVLQGRYLLALGIGAAAGPLAYGSGASVGALSLGYSWSLVVVGAEWALALPFLVWANAAIRRSEFSLRAAEG